MRLNLFRRHTDSSGGLGRILTSLGPTWSGSPVRRVVQVLCLLAFAVLFFYVCWPYGSRQYAQAFGAKEVIDAELFLVLDPLVSLSTAIAARTLVWSLQAAGVVILVCLVFPRAFCGYVCPLGTLLDGFDWLVGRRVRLFEPKQAGWWVNLRYYILTTVLVAAVFGILLSGFVAAIPVLTRAMLFIVAPAQMGLLKGWYLVPPWNAGHIVSILLVVLTFGLGFLGRRFWCSYLCPTGALFSVCSMLRLSERRVTDACVKCGRCVKACSFAAIRPDFSTRTLHCTFCQSCAGVCPAGAIEFTSRWARSDRTPCVKPETVVSRRGVLLGLGAASAAGASALLVPGQAGQQPIRPPGSVPEDAFVQLCIRCGQCIKVCPNNVLQPAGFEHGLNSLWTPKVVADWSGCEPSCNNCGQVCPTGAVRALALAEKQAARIALAQVDRRICLPHAGRGACQLCVDECKMAGYDAIEFTRVGGEVNEKGEPVEDRGYLAPTVREDRCVGCGLCQMRCHAINVKAQKLLVCSAIRIAAGAGNEDRIRSGSYLALKAERVRCRQSHPQDKTGSEYLPDFLK
jgi:ferredoxin